MPTITLIQSSLNQNSKTALILDEVAKILTAKTIKYNLIDLRKLNMEFCDGRELKHYNSDLQNVYQLMESSKAYIIGMPVYCYSVSGVLKNFLDITCAAMEEKYIGIVCNAGGAMSYLASADLMKILSYEVHAMPLQPIVYAYGSDFQNGKISNNKVLQKANDMVEKLTSVIK